jgi:hypothetical protein
LFPITFQLLRFRQPSGRYSTRSMLACQEAWRQNRRCLMFNIGSSDCKTYWPVFLTGKSLFCCQRFVLRRNQFQLTGLSIIFMSLFLSRGFSKLFCICLVATCLTSLVQYSGLNYMDREKRVKPYC